MNQAHIIGVEDAAFGFALSVLYAEQYNGQEIGSIQVINGTEQERHAYENCDFETLKRIMKTYEEQYFGWKERNIFERQWVLRDFRKTVGSSADEAYIRIKAMEAGKGVLSTGDYALLKALSGYWQHQYKLLKALKKQREAAGKQRYY